MELEQRYSEQKYIDELYADFEYTLNQINDGSLDKVEGTESFGIPSFRQYEVVSKVLTFLSPNLNIREHTIFSDLNVCIDNPDASPDILDFLKDIGKEPIAEITITSGSFWNRCLRVRKKIIEQLNQLASEHVILKIYTQAKEEEEYFNELDSSIKKNKNIFYDIPRRIFLHYILVKYKDNKLKLFFDFPHTEDIIYRLAMILSPEDFGRIDENTKQGLIRFLEEVIIDAQKC
jgi:hypothetical protein